MVLDSIPARALSCGCVGFPWERWLSASVQKHAHNADWVMEQSGLYFSLQPSDCRDTPPDLEQVMVNRKRMDGGLKIRLSIEIHSWAQFTFEWTAVRTNLDRWSCRRSDSSHKTVLSAQDGGGCLQGFNGFAAVQQDGVLMRHPSLFAPTVQITRRRYPKSSAWQKTAVMNRVKSFQRFLIKTGSRISYLQLKVFPARTVESVEKPRLNTHSAVFTCPCLSSFRA